MALPGGAGMTPALVGDHPYLVAGDGKLHALAAAAGKTLWNADAHGAVAMGGEPPVPSIDGAGEVFVYRPDGNLYRFGADGALRAPIMVSPAVGEFIVPQVAIGAEGALYIAGANGSLYAYQ